ncbi:MAG: 50S ribosomal protein L23 [Methanosarcinales archaeon Met12]|nr:MAG: 50S ribosomal protein L23 [Methanosarcinales archaeon Met12]
MTIKHLHTTEKATIQIDANNKLQFLVDVDATKDQIKREIENMYEVTITDIKTMMTPKGQKKAIVTLSHEDSAEEISTRLGVF